MKKYTLKKNTYIKNDNKIIYLIKKYNFISDTVQLIQLNCINTKKKQVFTFDRVDHHCILVFMEC